jgi:hypothetical protein
LLRQDDWFGLNNSDVRSRTHGRQLFSGNLLNNVDFLESGNYTSI